MAGTANLDERQITSLLRAARDAVVTSDLDGTISSWNPAAERLFGHPEHEALGRSALELLGLDVGPLLATLVDGQEPAPHDLRVRHRDGSTVLVHVATVGLADRHGFLCGVGTVAHDVTELRRVEHEARWRSEHDDVTGLANRLLVERGVAKAFAGDGTPGALCVDLHRFRYVNDTWGHATGDWVLAEIGQRLLAVASAGDTVGRLDSDVFVLVRPDVTADALQALAEDVIVVLDTPVELPAGPPIPVCASVGVAVARPDAGPADLLRDADSAVHRAKQHGSSTIVWFAEDLRVDAARRLLLQADLRRALDLGDIDVAYQPLMDLRTGEVGAVEALARWTHPTLGSISPAEFVAVAEEADLIGRLGAAVLDRACRDLAAGPPGLRCAVNVATVQLHDPGLVTTVAHAAARHGLDPARLTIEVVEAALGDGRRALASLQGLRRLGCRISVDDFGTGWSSLARIKLLPIDEIKIDRSFVAGLPGDAADEAVIDAVVRVARALGLEVVAEGVEAPEQLEAVRSLGCDVAQGYLLGRPGPMTDVPTS